MSERLGCVCVCDAAAAAAGALAWAKVCSVCECGWLATCKGRKVGDDSRRLICAESWGRIEPGKGESMATIWRKFFLKKSGKEEEYDGRND